MLNKAILIGRLTAEPELKTTPSGIYLCNFTLAVDRRFIKDAEKKTDFIRIVVWRERAEFVSRNFGKGDPMGVEGSIQTRDYEDKTGAKRTAVEVVADNVFFVSSKRQNNEPQAYMPPTHNPGKDFEETEADNDLPF